MADNQYIPYGSLVKFREEKFRIFDGAMEPKRNPKGEWSTPDGGALTVIPVGGGWHRVYLSKKKKTFWLMEIEGPDHGVHFYGPFPEKELPSERRG